MELYQEILIGIITFIAWLILYLKNKKTFGLILPYFILFWITPIYDFLDRTYFIKIFPCCPTIDELGTEIYTLNNLRGDVYSMIFILLILLTIYMSRKIKNKKYKFLYILGTIIITWIINMFIASSHLYR